MNVKRFLIGLLAALSLSLTGCASMSSTWDWFFEDDEEQMADAEYEEDEFEEEFEDEFEDEFEEEFEEDEFEEEMMDDDYGDRPMEQERRRNRASVSAKTPQRVAIYFDYKSASIPANGMNLLQLHGQYLRSNPDRTVVLAGHTDSVAPAEYNRRLSMQRAQSVARALVQMGVSESQIRVVARGEEELAAPGDDEQAQALNRRVELIYQ